MHGLPGCKAKKFLELVRSAKCLLAAVAHVKEAVFVLVRVINTSHQASCGKKLHHHYQFSSTHFYLCEMSSFDLLRLKVLAPNTFYNIDPTVTQAVTNGQNV
jgi:hypothetical protein